MLLTLSKGIVISRITIKLTDGLGCTQCCKLCFLQLEANREVNVYLA